jgi:hypothetical protein
MFERKIAIEAQAAKLLRERLIAAYGEDDEMIRDMIEGETSLHEAISKATFELAAVEGEKEGIEAAIGKMKQRLERYCNRAERIRAAIEEAMVAATIGSIKTPCATLSIRPSPPRLEITDISALPRDLMTFPAPVPNKNEIKAALKNGVAVPGVVLSNSPPVLSVRFV